MHAVCRLPVDLRRRCLQWHAVCMQVCDAMEDQMAEGNNLVDYHGCDFFPERYSPRAASCTLLVDVRVPQTS